VKNDSVRVLYLKQRFNPEPAPLRGAGFTSALRDHGVDLTVLTGFPYYPMPELYQGYTNRRHSVEQIDGTTVHRSASIVGHTPSAVRRLLSYVTMPAISTVNALVNRLQADLVLTTLGPGVYAHFALLLARRLGVPCVLEVQDLWPESLTASGMWPKRIPTAPVEAAMQLAYRNATAITCLSPGCRDAVIKRGGSPESTVWMLNWAPDVEVSANDEQRATELLGPWAHTDFICYAGSLGPLQGVDRMCNAAAQAGIRLVVLGDGREASALRAHVERTGAPVRFLGQQPQGVTRALLRQAASSTVYLAASELDATAIPSKIAANVTAGVPMVVAANGETKRLAERIDAGPRCAPGDTNALAEAFREVLDARASERSRWVRNANEFASYSVNAKHGLSRYAGFLATVARQQGIGELIDAEGGLV